MVRGEHADTDTDSSGDECFGDVGFMFDNALPKTRRSFRFGDISVAVRLVDDDPGAVQSGHYVWPAAPALSAYLVDRQLSLPRGGKCLELGAGCGLTGLVAAQLPCTKTVVFTDHDPGVLDMIRDSIAELERDPDLGGSEVAAKCRCVRLSWGPVGSDQRASLADALSSVIASPPSPSRANGQMRGTETSAEAGGWKTSGGPRGRGTAGDGLRKTPDGDIASSGVFFDLLLASDVIYSVSVVGPLFQTVGALLLPRPSARDGRREGGTAELLATARPPRKPAPVGRDEEEEVVVEKQAGAGSGGRNGAIPEDGDALMHTPKPPLGQGSFDDENSALGAGGDHGLPVFLMSQSFGYDAETERAIDRACRELGLIREVVWDDLVLAPARGQEGAQQQEPPPPQPHQQQEQQQQQQGAGASSAEGTHQNAKMASGRSRGGEILPLSQQRRAGTKLQRFWRA